MSNTRRIAALVVGVGVAHRLLLFLTHKTQLDSLIAANADWYNGQQLPIAALRDRLAEALLYLQQTPPLPNLVVGLTLKVFAFPYGVAYALIALQAVLSIATAVVLARILLVLYPRHPLFALLVASAFLINGDLVVLEYNSFGQTIYENLAMLLATVVVLGLVELRRTGSGRHALGVGCAVGALALTRATWSFYAPVAALLVAAAAPRARLRSVALFLLPVVLLQGGWTLKTRIVYGRWSLATSTFGGFVAVGGLMYHGLWDDFRRFVVSDEASHHTQPEWFLRTLAGTAPPRAPADGTHLPAYANDPTFPADVREQDERIQARFPGADMSGNGPILATFCQELGRSFVAFARAYPATVARKTLQDYALFWQPIRYYDFIPNLFAVTPAIENSFDLPDVARLFWVGKLPEQQLVVGDRWPRRALAPTHFWTAGWLEPIVHEATLLAVHVCLPILLALYGLRLLGLLPGHGGMRSDRAIALLAAVIAYGYLAAAVSIGTSSETMRYRLGVQPLIWLISVLSLSELRLVVRAWRQSRSTRGGLG